MASQASTAVATVPESAEAQRFGLMQRQARMFAMSPLVPEHLRKGPPEQAMANCYIAMTIADRMGEDRMTVMQNIHIVSGKAGFAAQYMIARANASGVFKGRIGWRIDRSNAQNLSVTAYATLAESGEVVEFTCDMAMAQAEQWTRNPKYKTMPEVMLRYRSATFLVRFYAPDVMLGYHTAEEVEDVAFVAGPAAEPLTGAMLVDQSKPVNDEADAVDEPHNEETGEVDQVEEVEAEIVEEDNRDAFGLEPLPERDGEVTEEQTTEEESPSDAKLREIRERIEAASTPAEAKKVDNDWVKASAAYDDDTQKEINAALAAKHKALREGSKGE